MKNAIKLYNEVSLEVSKLTTERYSTSFSVGIRLISGELRWAIYALYGMVRYADEIVDTFHNQDKGLLLNDFEAQTYEAIERKFSTNPILHAYQMAHHQFSIDQALVKSFFESMKMDLEQKVHDKDSYDKYVYGSAEVVGLMCLHVFTEGNKKLFNDLLPNARALGSAFQKVNFLRDLKSDLEERGRLYFPNVNFTNFSDEDKQQIIQEVKEEFKHALSGIKKLPLSCRFGVYTAYKYYLKLLVKIDSKHKEELLEKRIRVNNAQKVWVLAKSFSRYQLNLL